MTHEITGYDETTQIENEHSSAPPLCLVHYFGGSDGYPPERNPKPPGSKSIGRIAEQSGNLIILEFAPPPETVQAKWQKRRRKERLRDRLISRLFLLLLLVSVLGCFIASRF
ncbi:MAG: hypothetical protein ACRYFS_09740 [Janthinobacterium lividum]